MYPIFHKECLYLSRKKPTRLGTLLRAVADGAVDVPSPVPPLEVPAPRRALEATTAGVAGGILKACVLKLNKLTLLNIQTSELSICEKTR